MTQTIEVPRRPDSFLPREGLWDLAIGESRSFLS